MGLLAPSRQWPRTEAQPCRILRLVSSAASASGARLAHTERGLSRPIDDSDGTGRLTRCRADALNLWTVGCADPRLTAPARSPWTSWGNAMRFLPLAHRSAAAHKLHSNRNKDAIILFRGMINPAAGYPPLAYSSPEAVQTTGTVAELQGTSAGQLSLEPGLGEKAAAIPLAFVISKISLSR